MGVCDGGCGCGGCSETVESFLATHVSYSSVRVAKIHNWRFGLLYAIMQITVMCLVLIYGLVINRAYQRSESPAGVVNMFVRGSGGAYDSLDAVPNPLEYGAFFIASSVLITPQQSRSVCDDYASPCQPSNGGGGGGGAPNQPNAACAVPMANGNSAQTLDRGAGLALLTGNCSAAGYCSASGWCPLIDPNPNTNPAPNSHVVRFPEIGNFEFDLILSAYFPTFSAPLRYSLWNDGTGRAAYPTLYEIMSRPGWLFPPEHNFQTGATALMYVDLGDCNLDVDLNCSDSTTVTFEQFALKYTSRRVTYHSGPFNQTAQQMPVITPLTAVSADRTVYTYTGIRVVAVLGGRAGKFDFAALLVAIGSGFGMLSIATILTDSFIKWCTTNRAQYRQAIILDVHDTHKLPPHADASLMGGDDWAANNRPASTQLLAAQQ